jgi:hypothetical protein
LPAKEEVDAVVYSLKQADQRQDEIVFRKSPTKYWKFLEMQTRAFRGVWYYSSLGTRKSCWSIRWIADLCLHLPFWPLPVGDLG